MLLGTSHLVLQTPPAQPPSLLAEAGLGDLLGMPLAVGILTTCCLFCHLDYELLEGKDRLLLSIMQRACLVEGFR